MGKVDLICFGIYDECGQYHMVDGNIAGCCSRSYELLRDGPRFEGHICGAYIILQFVGEYLVETGGNWRVQQQICYVGAGRAGAALEGEVLLGHERHVLVGSKG